MIKHVIVGVVALFGAVASYAQMKIDTLYYDKNWHVEAPSVFASYYRVYQVAEDSVVRLTPKRFRSYYITGELQAEGSYLNLDREDDCKSTFEGDVITYYKSGQKEQSLCFHNGKREGEYTKYAESGLVMCHAFFKEDLFDGLYTEFSPDGETCTQLEYVNGEPKYNYYMLSNKEGMCSKLRLSDQQPVYESPLMEERQEEYQDGKAWSYYNKNGIVVGVTCEAVRDYGKYYQLSIVVMNNSMCPIDFDTSRITASFTDAKGDNYLLRVYSADEYVQRVKTRQNWMQVLAGVSEGLSAAGAGYSTSTTSTTYNTTTTVHGHGGHSSSVTTYGTASSTTTTYDAAAAYQAQVIASNRLASYEQECLSERKVKYDEYLKRTTLYPGDSVGGYINVERKKGVLLTLQIPIHEADYVYLIDISK